MLHALTTTLDQTDVRNSPSDSSAGVVLHAPFDDNSETAEETRAIAQRLAESTLPAQLVAGDNRRKPLAQLSLANRKTMDELIARRLDLARSVLYQAGAPTAWNLDFYGRYRVGRATFGTDRIPDGWVERCNALDELWLPSDFHRETFTASGVDARKIRVIHSGIDAEVFRPGFRLLRIPRARSFHFLAITDSSLHSGADFVVRAYVEEFAPDEDVALLLSRSTGADNAPHLTQAALIEFIEIELGRRLEEIPTITFLDGALDREERARLLASSQAFVNAANADATGRRCLEAMAAGVPVIAADWGAAAQVLTNSNSFLVETNGMVPANAEDELVAGHRWAEPNINHLRQRMRQVFTGTREAKRRAEQGRKDVIERFEWSVVFPRWNREFRRLLA